MFLYTVSMAAAAVIAGILIAVSVKKTEGIAYTRLDKAGRITNILLLLLYICLAPLYMFLAMIARPRYEGFLGILGWIVAIIMGAAPLSCSLGLGFSAALRKTGKSKLSFAAQFAGVLGIALNLILFLIFYGNLLRPLN